jgi:hypothetical protein
MKLFNQFRKYHLMDKAGEGEGGGGGAGAGGEGKGEGEGQGDKVTLSKEQYDGLMARIDKLEGKGKEGRGEGEGDDDDLITKAKKAKEQQGKDQNNSKALESALRFSMGSDQWLKDNKSLLPQKLRIYSLKPTKRHTTHLSRRMRL